MLIEHEVHTLVGQRVFGLALGYGIRTTTTNCAMTRPTNPVRGLTGELAGKLKAGLRCAPVVGKSTFNRLELSC